MIARVSDDIQYIDITFENTGERDQLGISFKKKIRKAKFRAKGKWNGEVNFYENYGRRIPIGLWNELQKMCDKFGFNLEWENFDQIFWNDINKEHFSHFCYKLMEGHEIEPYSDQIEVAYRLLRYRFAMANLSTSYGKTLILFFIITYLKYQKKLTKFLFVCIDMDLVVQAYNDFADYTSGKFKLRMCQVHGGSSLKNIDNYDIIIGNFQTLGNRPEEFFQHISHIAFDEAHMTNIKTIKQIKQFCKNALSRIGVSGTINDDNSADYWGLLEIMGPIVGEVTQKQLIDSGRATKILVKIIVLSYMSIENRRSLAHLCSQDIEGSQIFNLEQKAARSSKKRLLWVAKYIGFHLEGNVLVLFLDVKNNYGKNVRDKLKEITHDKQIYYVDGSTDKKLRKEYMERMEANDNVILVASIDTFSTGKSIKNLHHIVLIESRKDFNTIIQLIGRLMRLHGSKDSATLHDITDDFTINEGAFENTRNILLKHSYERASLYREHGHPCTREFVDLTKSTIF